jgi:membrane protease YdiL (CAAX protease family)
MTRPWWARLAAAFLLACGVWSLVGGLADAILGFDYSFASHTFRAVTTCALATASLAVLMRWDHTRPSNYGLTVGRQTLVCFGLGAVSYLAPWAVATSTILALNLARIEAAAGPLTVIGQGAALLVLVLLYEAVPEELIFRGYLFQVLAERLPSWLTIVVQALLFCAFGAIIGAAVTVERIVFFFLFSVSLGYLRLVTGTVFATIGFHAMFQLIAQWLLSPQWTSLGLSDPEQWFALVALGLAPFSFAPPLAALVARRAKFETR